MIRTNLCGHDVSMLGFGTMRLPLLADGSIDEAQVQEMFDLAMENGVNYFDTAFPYHGGQSEVLTGRALAKYPRDSWLIASKYPGHQIADSYNPAEIFEEQLKKCGVEYFDFYLLHNVYEKSAKVYMDPQWGILDYFKEQKRLGRIRHLGFSSHGRPDNLREFLDYCGDAMEFCQIQLNYLDWTLQEAAEKYELLTKRNIPIIVMEPVRGGSLAKLSEENEVRLRAARPDESAAGWAFRFLQGLPGVAVVLSGMSNMTQMQENIKTFAERKVLSHDEADLIFEIAESMKNVVPCTACRYCCDGCPMELNIPQLLADYNEIRLFPTINAGMRMEALPEDKRPNACIGCGACAAVCPQNIDIPGHLRDFSEILSKIPSWEQVCRERAEAARRMREGK
ncbi:MAG: 4Fe-4S dicluster domain-containing protein [Ruminococcaceae bacterium]|nr:4Fe-4S dicluster domain-containing protein [Oscillospiraceae bacterium]